MPKSIVLWDAEVRETAHKVIDALELEGKHEVIIRKHSQNTSDRQRGYYRTVVLRTLGEELGYDEEDMHEVLKQEFGEAAQIKVNGKTYDVTRFTTSRKGSVEEMQAYLERVCRWAASELGIYIEPPDIKGRIK